MEERSLWVIFKDFLFGKANKEFLIFLFFLLLSGVFWLFLTLNETYEKDISIPVTITNVPKNVMLTSAETDTVKMTVRDKGITLATYIYGNAMPHLMVDYATYARKDGTIIVPASDMQKMARQQLASGSKIVVVKTDKLEFYYNYGDKKRVPVRWSGRVIPEQLFYLSHVQYWPDSVTVYAPAELLDSINLVYTEPLNYVNFRDTLMIECNLQKHKGVKFVPEQIKIGFYTDVLTEESVSGIPIQGINMPPGKVLRTFPSKVTVHFVAGASVFRSLKPEDFQVVAYYDELRNGSSDKCRIYLQNAPSNITRARLDVTQVDYIIEEEMTARP